jgi:hypothetical protein
MLPEKKKEKHIFQRNINIKEVFSNEEIKLLRNLTPEINNLIKSASNKKYINNNLNSSYTYNPTPSFVPKGKFYKLILEDIQKFFIKERNHVISKVISLLIKEIINVSKIIQENAILNRVISNLTKNSEINSSSDIKKLLDLNLAQIDYYKTYSKKNIRSNSVRNYSPFEQNASSYDNRKLFKGAIKNTSKKSLYNIEYTVEKEYKNDKKENGYTDSGVFNDNKTNDTINNTNNENGISNSKNERFITNMAKKSNNRVNFKQNYKIRKDNNVNSIKNNLFNKGRISSKKYNNTIYYTKNRDKENKTINRNTNNKSTSKRIKFNNQFNKEEPKKSLNKSFSVKDTKISEENKKASSPNISIVNFLKENPDVFLNIETTNFDIINLDNKIGKENTLSLIGYYIFNRFGFYDIINYNKFEKWCKKISEGYIRTNPYHTDLHAADITHTCFIYFKIGKVNEICKLSKSSKCSLFLSCICHDYKHPGLNNNYLKETKNLLALTYNDNSILENMHISETFKLINYSDEYNIFDKLENNIYKQLRKEMISCVLATDMTFHNYYVDFMNEQINKIKAQNNGNNINEIKDKEKEKDNNKCYQNYMNLLIHSADISNPTKPFEIYWKWAKMVIDEFYEQGDKEKELGLACFCDRNKTTIYQSQLGFINFIEIPFYSLFGELFKKLKFYYDTLMENKNKIIILQQEDNNKKENEDKNI